MSEYAERDPEQLDKDGDYYFKHVNAMTVEDLHSKAAIAAELAYRDKRIAELEQELVESQADADVGFLERENLRLKEEDDASGLLIAKLSDLLKRTVNVIKGEPPELTLWSYHDLPELAKRLKHENENLRKISLHAASEIQLFEENQRLTEQVRVRGERMERMFSLLDLEPGSLYPPKFEAVKSWFTDEGRCK